MSVFILRYFFIDQTV